MLKNRIFIGRNEENDIVVPAVFNVVSGSHADLKLLDSGEYLYSDHSTNGSTVKGKKIRNQAVTVAFGTPIILATRFALDWERVRELLPPPGASAATDADPQASTPTQLRGSQAASDWRPSHPADFTSIIPDTPQPVYDRSSHIDPQEMPQSNSRGKHRRTFDLSKSLDEDDPRATRMSNDPRETRMSNDPRETRMSNDPVPPGLVAPPGMRSRFQSLGLRPGDMFGGRFLLVRNIGAGASATVWEAQDTKTGGLKVAIKIFSLKHGMDSYGFQNLQREFTTVFNFTQQYLLTPSFYDVCEGCPYLVMRFCERGSAAKLIGSATEAQVIKLLHDVASGLEYLHAKQIIHQDIKPDNILQADNGDFMITDFGISATIDALNDNTDMSGGTRAYMGPERFNGQNVSGSDIWSLGATAYELVTGDAPHGDNGGMMQAYGNAVPPITQKLQPEVKDIIMRCLEKDPAKRPTAAEIRKKIDIYYETGGSWKRKNKAKTALLIVAAAVLLMGLGAGIWIWDYNRVKTSYYAAVTEVYGVPQGVGKEVKHGKRAESFMLQKQRGKVIRMANVNSAGKVVPYLLTEFQLRYFPDVHYEYGADGSLKRKNIYNEHGRPLFSMEVDIDKEKGTGTAAFYRFDEDKTEMLLPLDINQNFKDKGFYGSYSAISKYRYKYDDDGHVSEVKYLGFGSRPTTDQYGIGGIKYTYDDRGLISWQQYIDVDGKPTCDNNGLSVKEYEYDDDGNITQMRLLNLNNGPAHIGTHCAMFKYEYDEYGNMSKEMGYTLKGKPDLRSDIGCHVMEFIYDERGNRAEVRYYDKKGKLVEDKNGVAFAKFEYNDDGFRTAQYNFAANEKPMRSHGDNLSAGKYVMGPTGLPIEERYYDEAGNPWEDTDGIFLIKNEFDDYGNLISVSYFDKNEKPIKIKGYFHKVVLEYDDKNNCISVSHYDKNDRPATQDGVVSSLKMKYNPWGAVTEILYFNTKGKPTRNSSLVAGVQYEYSSQTGKETKGTYVDRDGKTPTLLYGGDLKYATFVNEYDAKGHLIKTIFKDAQGKETVTVHTEKDDRDNTIKNYEEKNGKIDGLVKCSEYDDNNNLVTRWYLNANGSKANCSNGYHKAKYKYDELGHEVECTYWGINGQRVVDESGVHKYSYVNDRFDNVEEAFTSDASGRPVHGAYSVKYSYDDNGNETEMRWCDKKGNTIAPTGQSWGKRKLAYDANNNLISLAYFDKQNRPVDVDGFCKYEVVYDDFNRKSKVKSYNTRGLVKVMVFKYNSQGSETEEYSVDANNRLTEDGKYVFDYEQDGVTPKTLKFYNQYDRLVGTIPWDDKNKEWDFNRIRRY